MSKQTIYLRLGGGLGNQIFQYMAGLYVAEIHGAKAVFDLAGVEASHHGPKSSITNIAFPNLEPSSGWVRTSWKIKLRVAGNRKFLVNFLKICRMDKLGYEDFTMYSNGSIRLLEGFFITHKYMVSLHEKGMIGELKLRNPSEWFLSMVNETESKKVCAIHIRQGDYLQNWKHYGILSSNYYSRALNHLHLGQQIDEYWIFSDTPETASQIIQSCGIDNYKIIVQPFESNDSESMALMSSCDAIVCANSTFSIVSALFSKASRIIVPDVLYRSLPNPAELYPSDWIQIESEWLQVVEGKE